MVTGVITNLVSTMAQSAATSPHRTMALLWMHPICLKGGQLYLQMLTTKLMKESYTRVSLFSGEFIHLIRIYLPGIQSCTAHLTH